MTRGATLFSTALAFGAILAGCGEGGEGGGNATGEFAGLCAEVLPAVDAFIGEFEQPTGERYGGTVVYGGPAEIPGGMNAFVSTDVNANVTQRFVNLMTLVRFDEDLQPYPYLAESWEFAEGDTAVTFHLRDDVYWHDGTPTTAHDVEFTFLRATDPETGFPNIGFWNYYVAGPEGVEVIDSLTVRFSMRPHSEPLDSWRATPIMPRHLLEDVPPSQLAQHPFGTRCPVGNGPFVFESHDADASWSFVRNPAFPEGLGGPPYLERFLYRIVPESTTLLSELLTERIDFFEAPGPDMAARIEASPDVELHVFPYPAYLFVIWNSRRPQLADARVRRALTVGTNRAEILEAIRSGYGELANTGVPPFHWAYDPALRDSLAYDPDEARALLDEAGWIDRDDDGVRENADGIPLEISIRYNQGVQVREDIAQVMQAQLEPLGIAVTPEVVEWTTLVSQITDPELRAFDGVVIAWNPEFRLDDYEILHSNSVDAPYGFAGIEDPELDRLIDTLQVVTDREEAIPFWLEYQHRILEVQPFTYLYFEERLAGVNRRLRDVQLDIRGEIVGIRDWWIPADER